MAPLAVALAFRHAARAMGARRAAVEMAALAGYGFTLEAVAIAVFASHRYDASWRVAPLGVPLAVAGVWAAVLIASMAVAWRSGVVSPLARSVTAALVAITLDLMIEPVATRAGLWRWTPPGPWLNVPIGNFVGWGVIVGAYAYGAARCAGTGPVTIQAVRRIALAAACILALVLVGTVWTSLGLERAFNHGRGWLVWAAVLLASVWRMIRGQTAEPQAEREAGETSSRGGTSAISHGASLPPEPPTGRRPASPAAALPNRWGPEPESSLPARLAATPGRGPEAALCLVGLAFAVEALRIAEPEVTVAATGSLATIGIIAAGLRRRPA